MKQFALCALVALTLAGCKNLTDSDPEQVDAFESHITKHTDRPAAACTAAARLAGRTTYGYRRAAWRVGRAGQLALADAVAAFESLVAQHTAMIAECSGEQTYAVGGTVTGLVGGNTVALQNNGVDDVVVSTNGPFTFAATHADGEGYDVSVAIQPPNQSCSVTGGAGSITGADVLDIDVQCVETMTGVSSPSAAGDLVITEFISNPAAVTDASGEWFEIYNPTATAFELRGLVVRDDGANEFTVGESLIIQPGALLIFGTNGDQATNGGAPVDFAYSGFTLANASDEIELVMGETVIDRVAYDSTFPLSAGQSTSLNAGSLDAVLNDNGANWCNAQVCHERWRSRYAGYHKRILLR